MKSLFVILSAIFLFFISGLSPTYAQTSSDEKDNIQIKLTDNGFEPDFIKIMPGTKVTWVNRGEKLHWPASDFHPTHKKYPGSGIEKCRTIEKKNIFDACIGLKKYEQYAFTFNNAGIWSVHDHLFLGFTMTVEVVESDTTIRKEKTNFFYNYFRIIKNSFNLITGFLTFWSSNNEIHLIDLPESESFLKINEEEQRKMIKDLSNKNPKETWEFLKKTFMIDGRVVGNPHGLSHIIGNEIYNEQGLKGITSCDSAFAFGCYHGVTEQMLADLGRNAIPDAEQECLEIFPANGDDFTGCFHGMGHGLLESENMNIKQALADCDLLSPQFRHYCYDGVFMENSFNPAEFDPQNSWAQCETLPTRYQHNCARYQAPLFMAKLGFDYALSSSLCFDAPSIELRDTCLLTLGHQTAQDTIGNIDEIRKTCNLIENGEGKYVCLIGAAQDVLFQQYKDSDRVSSELCEQLPGDWKNRCFKTISPKKESIDITTLTTKKASSDEIILNDITGLSVNVNINLQEELKSDIGKCVLDPKRNECYDKLSKAKLQKNSFDDIIQAFDQLEANNEISSCHDYMQYLARNEFSSNPDLPQLFNRCTAACFGACYHGAVEGFLTIPYHDYSSMNPEEARKTLLDACAPLKNDARGGFYGQCVHGIGHGAMLITDWDLNQSLKLCDLLPPESEQQSCYGGVFMEFFPSSTKSDFLRTSQRSDELYYPCTELEEKYLNQCYAFLTTQFSASNDENPFVNCEPMDPKYRLICYNTLGTSSLGKTSDPNELKKYCDMAPAGKPRNLCVIGTILSYTDRYGGNPTKLFGMFDFCAEVDTEYKFHCYNKIGLALQEWLPSENDQKDACNLVVDQEYKELCLNPNWDRPQELFNVDVETPKKIDTEPLSEQDSTLYLALKTKEACNDFNRPQLLNKEICYSKKFEDISFNGGPDYAYKVLFELQELDPEALGCHFIGHGIGYGAYKQNPEGWQNQINNINPACGYGSVHGTIERYVDNLPEGKFTKGMLPTLCGSNPRADCNHIIGHLTLVEVNANVDAGLDMCLIFEDDYQRSFCLTGIFMEYQTAFNLISHGLAPRSWLNWPARVDELEKLCRSYKGENATACWKEISHAALVKFNHDPYKIFEFCNSAQVWEGAGLCKRHSLGIMNAGVNYDLNSLRYVCQIEQPLNDPTFEHDCYMTLVSSKIYTLPPEKVKDTVSFCLSINPEFQSVCFTQIGLALNAQSTSMEMIEEICSSAPAEFKSNCLFGLGIKTQTT